MTIRIHSKILSILFICCVFTSIVNATVFTSVTAGNFENPNTWDVGGGLIPGAMDDVIIRHEIYLNLTSKRTINDISISNIANARSGLDVYGTDSLVILNNVQATSHNINKHVYLWIGGNSTVIINGNCHFLRVAENNFDKYFDFSVVENAQTFIKGSFRFDYLGAASSENNKEIYVEDNALLDIEGKTIFTGSGGDDFNFVMNGNAEAFFRDSLIMILNGTGLEVAITLHNSSMLQILSSAYLFNSSTVSNDYTKLRSRGEGSIYIQENVYMESHGASVKLEMQEIGGTITVGGDIIMNASAQDEASINIIDKGELYLGGDLIRQTDFGKLTMADQGALILNGSSPQTIPQGKLPNSGTDSLFFKEVRLENTSSQPFVLTENFVVKDFLILANGNLVTDSTAMVVLEDGATISGSKTAYVEGPVMMLGTTEGQDITLPIGTDKSYAPITISAISNPSSEVTVQYLSEPPPFGVETFDAAEINNVSGNGHWTIEKNASTGDLNLTLTWEDSNEAGITEINDLVVAGWDGTEWKSYGQASAGTIGTGGFVTSALSEPPPFGVETFTIASTSSLNSLPVELRRFDAIPRSGRVDLEWETESEINASHFLVERSTDGLSYESIEYVKTTGGISASARYTAKDISPSFGWNYYRLRMVDLDGSYEYSPIEAVKLDKDASILVYPNPVKDVLFIQDIEAVEDEVRVEIFDRNSSKVFEDIIYLNNGPVQLTIEDIQFLPSGYYIVKITGKSGCKFVSFVMAE